MNKFMHFIKQWHHRLLLLLLGSTFLLIVSLAYKIHQKQTETRRQYLTIQAGAWMAVKNQTYGILITTIQQDFATYTGVQETLGEDAGLAALAMASNESYESRFLESVNHLGNAFGREMAGILYFPADGDASGEWFQEDFPYKDSINSLIGEMLQRTPSDGNIRDPELRLLKIFGRACMLLCIPLKDQGQVVCVFDADTELQQDELFISATDKDGVSHKRNPQLLGAYVLEKDLYGLSFNFSTKSDQDGFLATIVPMAILVLILILYQSQIALHESTTHELTGLPNMRSFDRLFQSALRKPGMTFLFFLDLRNLKLLNSIFLEEQADDVIRHFARTLRATLDRGDPIIHRSGDEILVVMTLMEVTMLEHILQRVQSAFRKGLRLRVMQNKDPKGRPLKLYGKQLPLHDFVDLQISFRIGGFAVDSEAQKLSRKELLEHANLLGEDAKSLEVEEIPGVVWRVRYRLHGEEILLESPPLESTYPRLVKVRK